MSIALILSLGLDKPCVLSSPETERQFSAQGKLTQNSRNIQPQPLISPGYKKHFSPVSSVFLARQALKSSYLYENFFFFFYGTL